MRSGVEAQSLKVCEHARAAESAAGTVMRRDQWFSHLCSSALRLLPGVAARALRTLPDLDTPADPWRTPDLGPAVVASEVARRYAAGEHPDDIVAWFGRARLHPPDHAATDIIVAICESYRMGNLPFPRWWRPDELTGTLLRWYTRWRIAAAGIEAGIPELVDRWELSDEDASEILVNATAEIVDAPGVFTEPGHDPPSRWLRKVAVSKETRKLVDAALARYPATLHVRDDLLAMACYRETHAAVASCLNATGGCRDPVVIGAVERLNVAMDASTSVLLSLGPYERRLLEPQGELESKFAQAMEIRRHTFHLDALGGANALPDRVDGSWRATDGLNDYVYQQGGRIVRRSAGPIAHWTLVLEDVGEALVIANLLADPRYMPRGGLGETSDHLAAFHLELDDDPSDPLYTEFVYHDMPDGLLDLVVLMQTRVVRLDVFALCDGALAGVGTRAIWISDATVARLLDRMLPKLDALLANADATARARVGVERADDWAIVAAVDAAKSTDLLAALDPELIIGVARPDAKRRDDFRAVRSALLDALAARAAAAAAGEAVDVEAIDRARRQYARTIQQLRAPRGAAPSMPEGRDGRARVNQLVEGLVNDRRAVLTLTLGRTPIDGSTRLGAYWVSGDGRRRAVGKIEDSAISLEQLQGAARLPVQEASDLDALIAASPTLGRDLVAPLLARGVRELTIVPISFCTRCHSISGPQPTIRGAPGCATRSTRSPMRRPWHCSSISRVFPSHRTGGLSRSPTHPTSFSWRAKSRSCRSSQAGERECRPRPPNRRSLRRWPAPGCSIWRAMGNGS